MEDNKLYTEMIDEKLDLILQELKNFSEKLSQSNNRINTINLENQTDHKNIATALNHIDQKIASLESEHSAAFEKIDERFEKIDKRFEQVDERFEQIDKRFEQVDKRFEQVDKRFEQVDKRFEQVDKRFEQVDERFEKIDKKIEGLESEHSTIFERLDSLDKNIERVDRRITNLKSDNNEEHAKIMELLTSLNSAFIRYETEGLDKIKILFDSDTDRRNHQDIYGHEFQRINDLVAKNSFRISNLEQHQY